MMINPNLPQQQLPPSADFADLNSLNAKFYKFHPTDKTGFFSRIGKKIKRTCQRQQYQTLKEQLVKQITKLKTLDESTIKPLRSAKPVSGKLIIRALQAVEQQHETLKSCVELAKSSDNTSKLKDKLDTISNIAFLKKIKAEIEKDELDTDAKNVVERRINYLSLPAKDDIKKRSNTIFDDLKKESALLHKPSDLLDMNDVIGGLRFRNIRPPRATAVTLKSVDKKTLNTMPASYVGNNYIATQGPKTPAASADAIPSFYQMLLDNNSNTVVNLTNANDNKNSSNLQLQYWPNAGNTVEHTLNEKLIKVSTTEIESKNGFDIVTIKLTQEQEERDVTLFHFTSWPDYGVPTEEAKKHFQEFNDALRLHTRTGKTVVHCRAGVGRTGTQIVMEQLREGIKTGEVHTENFIHKTKELILQGRRERGTSFVQTKEQLQFIIEELIDDVLPPIPPRKKRQK